MFFAPSRTPPRVFERRPPEPVAPPPLGGEYSLSARMRRARLRPGPEPGSPPVPPPLGVLAYTRAGFGLRPGELAAFNALGSTDLERLTAWVDQQLEPSAIVDTECDQRLVASEYATLGKSLLQLWQEHFLPDDLEWDERLQPATESELATWTRAVYSKRQLYESVVHFWHNHFNVYAYEFVEGPVWGHWDREVVRAHALGNFRQMLQASCQAPAMLVYLDNFLNFAENGAGYSNENFARELLELHTLGADAFYGRTPRDQVPRDPQDRPLGYCEEDVRDVARALTGWTFDIEWIWPLPGTTGQFVYMDQQSGGAGSHSTEAKIVLGVDLPAGRTAQQDGLQALDVIASHPATGRFLAKKLCRRFVGDFPPQGLIDSAAALWTSLWQDPQQIRKVIRHILVERPEFRQTWGEKIKRPFEIVVSALRAGDAQFRFYQQVPAPPDWNDWDPDFQATASLHWIYEAAGQVVFGWHPPNGHPDLRAAWQCATPRVALWRAVNWLIEADENDDDRFLNVVAWTLANLPAGGRTTDAVVDAWITRVYRRGVPTLDRDQFVDFLSQGFNPGLDLPLDTNDWPYYWKDRLRALVGLMLMSPEFLWR
jgi:uncharacterized protein (DUF1800 family)